MEWNSKTRSSANADEPCEQIVSWNRLKCCTNVQQTAFENACDRWKIFKVIQGHCRCCHLIGHTRFPVSLSLHHFRDTNTYLPKKLRRHMTLTTFTWRQFVIARLILLGPTRTQNLTILSSAIPEKYKVLILKWITWLRPRPFQG